VSKMVGFLTGPVPLVVEKRNKAAERLQDSCATIEGLENKVAVDVSLQMGELREGVALLHRELLKTIQKAPRDTSPLSEPASWTQQVDDKCYGVAQMEQRLTSLMQTTRKALSEGDEGLHLYGQKHFNLIKQAQIVEALNIPGVSVPVPYGI